MDRCFEQRNGLRALKKKDWALMALICYRTTVLQRGR